MKITKMAIASVTVAAAAALAVTIWKRAGRAPVKPSGDDAGDLEKFWGAERADEPAPVG
jgi:hypothetical protein